MGQYSILVIPENHLESKRFRFSKFSVHLGLGSVVLALIYTTLMTWGFLHYRQVANQMANINSPAEEVYRSEVLAKVNHLEDSLKRTQQFATRMESMLDVETGKLKMGIGPLSDQVDFGKSLKEVSQLPRAKDIHFTNDIQHPEKSQNFYQSLGGKIDELSDFAMSLETRMNEVYEIGQDKFSYWASTPSIWPVRGWVTSDFGGRSSPFTGAPRFHEGIDIAAVYGSPIYAPSDGIVSFSGSKGGYGNALIIDHGFGISTLYGHTSGISVKVGDKVKRGELVASVGSSGSSTGPHLHYEVHVDGVPTDPMKFVLR